MRVLAISDLHGRGTVVKRMVGGCKGIDLVIYAGDAETKGVIDTLASLGNVLAVPGNMDPPAVIRRMEERGISIDGRVIERDGIRFAGIGDNILLEDTKARIVDDLRRMEGEKWVLVSHLPPKGTKVDVSHFGRHIGSRMIYEVIREFKPIACICGHVHESRGIDRLEETLLVNPGPGYAKNAAIIDLNDLDAELITFARESLL